MHYTQKKILLIHQMWLTYENLQKFSGTVIKDNQALNKMRKLIEETETKLCGFNCKAPSPLILMPNFNFCVGSMICEMHSGPLGRCRRIFTEFIRLYPRATEYINLYLTQYKFRYVKNCPRRMLSLNEKSLVKHTAKEMVSFM
jgi:hypothetical protein